MVLHSTSVSRFFVVKRRGRGPRFSTMEIQYDQLYILTLLPLFSGAVLRGAEGSRPTAGTGEWSRVRAAVSAAQLT